MITGELKNLPKINIAKSAESHDKGGSFQMTNKTKLISTLLTFTLIFSLFATTAFAAASTFKDVPETHWANSAVESAPRR